MKIKLIPETHDEEKIAEIRKMKETLNDDDFFYQLRCLVRHDEKNFDAIYYATPNGAELLAEVENYLQTISFMKCVITTPQKWLVMITDFC